MWGWSPGFCSLASAPYWRLFQPWRSPIRSKNGRRFSPSAVRFYTLLAGATVPTERAFVMIGLILVAVILDRQGISMRLVAIAAFVILLLQPEAMLGPSFQMSFAAVIALIAAYEKWGRVVAARTESHWRRRAALYLAGIALTSVIVTLATASFAVHHFNRIAVLGLATNMLAVRAMPVAGLIALALGGLWLCLWRRRWRYLGAIGIAAGLASLVLLRQPDILIDGKGRLFALFPENGRIILSSRNSARFSRDVWLRRAGLTKDDSQVVRNLGLSKQRKPASVTNPMCDRLGCIWKIKGQTVALITDAQAVPEDCRRADIVVSMEPVPWQCPSAHTVLDWFDLWRHGSHAIWLTTSGARVESVNGARGNRPWVSMRKRRTRATAR
jgi:competence protein ComEC